MRAYEERVREFLNSDAIAVVGVSRDPKKGVGCFLLKKLREGSRRVYAVNPHATQIEGQPCYASLSALPERVESVLVLTHPKDAVLVARDCVAQGVKRVWFHRSFGQGSYSEEAEALCRQAGLETLARGCPAMFLSPDIGHRCGKLFLRLAGKLK